MKKLLYVDIPFAGIQDGGANRSKFLWKSLCKHFEVDWLQISKSDCTSEIQHPSGMTDHFTIKAAPEKRFWLPKAVFNFSYSAKRQFKKILKQNNYQVIFYRFLSPVRLAHIAQNFNPDIVQVIDVDMLMSRLNKLSWLQDKSFKNRYYFLENLKLEKYEKSVMKNPWLFLFTNREEADYVKSLKSFGHNDNIDVLPNVMAAKDELNINKENRILFFGTLNSAANSDALQFIAEDIYPLLQPVLEKHNIYLDIAGRGWKDSFKNFFTSRNRLRYLGEVDDINVEIAKSIIVFLPLRIASGTRTRILEAANQAAPVITTKIGVEGLELGKNELIIKDKPEEMVKEIEMLLENKNKRKILGQQLRMKSRALYLDENVSSLLYELILKQR